MNNEREMEELFPLKVLEDDEHLLPHQQQQHHDQDQIPTSVLINLYLGHFLARWGAR